MFRSKTKYLRFVSNALLFLCICAFFDQVTGNILRHYYFTSTSGINYQTTYAMDSTKADIIILGSSRASHHYIPKMMEDSLGMSCYNTGRDGNYLLYNYAVFTAIVKRYSPKIIILDVSPEEISFRQQSYDGLATLLPYYKDKPELRKEIKLKSSFESIKLRSSIYPFNSSIIALVTGHQYAKNGIADTLKGYLPLYGSSVKPLKVGKIEEAEIINSDLNKIEALKDITARCKKLDIRLLVINSPRYSNVDQSNAETIISKIAQSNHAEFFTYSKDTTFLNAPEFFKDGAHLNNEGAIVFTNLVINRLLLSKNVQVSGRIVN